MKKLLLILLCVPLIGLGQNVKERIDLIKKMYKETNELSKKSNNNCKEIEEIEYATPGDIYSRPYITKIKYCIYENGYSRITYEFQGDHWGEYNEYYFRYNSLYFSYLTEGGEGVSSDSRQYFNEKGELIRNLVDVGEGNKNSNSKAYLSNLQYCQKMLMLHQKKKQMEILNE